MNCNSYKKLILVLAAVMLMLAAGMTQAQERMHGLHGPKRGQGLKSNINLSDDQKAQFQKYIRDSREKMFATRSDLRNARMELAQQMSKYDFDEQQVQSCINKINGLQRDMLDLNLNNQIQIRQILTRDQFEQLSNAVSGGDRKQPKFGEGNEGSRLESMKSLGLTEEQKAKIDKLWEKSKGKAEALRTKLETESKAIHDLYLNYDLDQKAAKIRIETLSEVQMQHLKAMVARQTEVRKILTKEQLETLSKTIGSHRNWREHKQQ